MPRNLEISVEDVQWTLYNGLKQVYFYTPFYRGEMNVQPESDTY